MEAGLSQIQSHRGKITAAIILHAYCELPKVFTQRWVILMYKINFVLFQEFLYCVFTFL